MVPSVQKNVYIKGKFGKLSVQYTFFKNKKPLIILVHGFNSKKNSRIMIQIRDFLIKKEISTMSVDLYGHGKSYGEFEDFTITKGIDSLSKVFDYAKKKFCGNIGVFATSMGGLAAIFALKDNPMDFVILRSPVIKNQGDVISNYHKLDLKEWKKDGGITVDKVGTFFKLKYNFYSDAQKYNALNVANSFKVPVLIFHGDKDDFVPFDSSFLFSSNISDCSFIKIKNATHSFSDDNILFMLNKIIYFLEKKKFL